MLGVEYLKEEQKQAAVTFLQGKDTFVSLPTAYGKSLIFALVPSAFDFVRGNWLLFKLIFRLLKLLLFCRVQEFYSGLYHSVDIHNGGPTLVVCTLRP